MDLEKLSLKFKLRHKEPRMANALLKNSVVGAGPPVTLTGHCVVLDNVAWVQRNLGM